MRRIAGGVRALLFAAVASCTPTPGEQLKSQVQSFQKEQEPMRLFQRGRAFAQVGDFTRAEEYLEAAIDAGQDPRQVMPLLLTVCIRGQRYRVAVQHAEQHLKRFPNDVSTRFLLGTLYVAIGELVPARRELDQVVRERPNDAPSHFALAVLLRDSDGERAVADLHFREYMRLEPSGIHVDEARASLTKPLEALPRLPTVPSAVGSAGTVDPAAFRDGGAGAPEAGPLPVRLPPSR